MSGILNSIGKVFKKIIKSPIFKIVLIAVAVYFTAGLALGALGSAFAASLPGIAGAAEGLGITAGAFGAAGAAGAGAGVAAAAAGSVLLDAGTGAAALDAGATLGVGAASAGIEAAGGATLLGEAGLAGAGEAAAAAGSGVVDAAVGAMPEGLVSATTEAGGAAGDAAATGAESGLSVTDSTSNMIGNEGVNVANVSADGAGTTAPTTGAVNPTTGAVEMPELPGNAAGTTPSQSFGAEAGDTVGSAGTGTGSVGSPYVAPESSGWQAVKNWWSNLGPGEKKIAYEGLSQGAKAAIGAVSQKQVLDQQQYNIDRNKADVIRKGQVADRTSFYKTPGLVNSAINGKG